MITLTINCDGCGIVITDNVTTINFAFDQTTAPNPIQLCSNCAQPLLASLPAASASPTAAYTALRSNVAAAPVNMKL